MTISHPLLATALAAALTTAGLSGAVPSLPVPPLPLPPPVGEGVPLPEVPLLSGATGALEGAGTLLGALEPPEVPADLLDFSNWKLTLPTGDAGSPEELLSADLSDFANEFFQVSQSGDAVIFMAEVGGVTTKNSKYPRSELREMNGEEKAAWSNTEGTHTLESRQAITKVPPAKPEVSATQIHDGGDDVMQIRLEGTTLVAQYADGDEQIVIDPDYRLGTPYDLKIVAADGRIVVFYDGEQRAEIERDGDSWYWKVGAYTQSNPERGDDPDAVGEVVVYSLAIEHTG